MAIEILAGALTTPYLVSETVGQTSDLSQTQTFSTQFVMTQTQIRSLRIGGRPPSGAGGQFISSVGSAKRLDGSLFEIEVQSIASPRDYSYTDLQQVTFLPFIGMANPTGVDPETAKAISSRVSAVSILTACTVTVRFVTGARSAMVRPTTNPQPTFRGGYVSFYGHAFNGDGVFVGTTSPFSPPRQTIVSQSMDSFTAGFFAVKTTVANRPSGV